LLTLIIIKMSFCKKIFFILSFLVLGAHSNSSAQTFSIQQYTTEDGLPGSTAYSIVQDKNQMLWIATDGGVCKFDGLDFHPLKDENIQGEVIKIFYDSKDRLWMINLALQVSYLDLESENIRRFEKLPPNYPIINIFEDLNQNYWFLHPRNVSVIIDSDSLGEMPQHQVFEKETMGSLKYILPIDQNHIMLISRFGVDHFKNYKQSFQPFQRVIPTLDFPLFAVNYGDSILLSTSNRIFYFSPNEHILRPIFTQINHLLDLGINNLFFDSNQNLWVATRDGIIYLKKQKDGSTKIFHLLKGYATQSVFQDHENNFWIATQQEGIFKLSSNEVLVYKNEKYGDRASVVHSLSENEIIVGYNNNGMVVLDDDLNSTHEKKLSVSNEEIYDIKYDSIKNELYVVANFGIFKINNESFEITSLTDTKGFKTCAIDVDHNIWLGSFASTSIYKKDEKNIKVLPKRTYSICFGKGDQVWLGTIEGLFSCKNLDCEKVPIPELYRDIRDLQMDKDGVLWIATQSNGIFLYKDGKIVQHFNAQNGLSSNSCYRILLDNQLAWVATNNGISKINTQSFDIEIIRKDDGLPSNEVKFLHAKKGKIYAATSKGLAIFEKDIKIYSKPPRLSFSGIQIKNQDTLILPQYEIPHDQNDLKINFIGTTFKNARAVQYEYKMSPINTEWVSSSTNVVSFPALPFGDYDFLVRAKSLNSDWSEIKKISFFVKKAYWQTWWFFGLVAFVSFLTGAKSLHFVFDQIKERNEIQQNLKASQLTALRAQMNPHFIFNALNSIQDFIIQEDKRSANRYLSKFSKLMRYILDASDKDKITLKKEIEYLELYLSLESLRIDDDFEYNFDIDPSINVNNILIPSMLLQPYVENALKHGLMHRNGKKKLTLRFSKNCPFDGWEKNHLFCEIEDNGVGRTASMKINEQNGRVYQSKAMSLTQDRIDLLNSTDTSKLSLKIEDLKNKDGSSAGTKVNICIFQNKSI
jgi:ligand-binding sensor domain-containing protein/two-component sensor histidine kinase